MKNWLETLTRYKIHHIVFWMGYYVFWIWVYKDMYEDFSYLLLVTGVYLLAHSSVYYITQYLLIPKVLRRYNFYVFLPSFALLTFIAAFGMKLLIFDVIGLDIRAFGGNISQVYVAFAFSILFMSGLLIAATFLLESTRNQRNNEKLKKERLESELQYLKAQVNPHFLFNAINSVYVLIKIDPNKAADMLIKLSDLLRAQLYEFTGEAISIDQELNYIDSYIALEKIRRGDRLDLQFEKGENLRAFSISPLILIPFLENCFKHLSNYKDKKNEIKLNFDYADGIFTAQFINSVDPNPMKEAPGGIGLKNIQRRLDLIYPKRHQLSLGEDKGYFHVNLKLNIHGE